MASQDRADEDAPTGARAKPLILLVDDDADNRDMYATYLERRGFEVAQAANGRAALEQTATLRPDLIVMDLTLPDMDGLQVIHQLDADPAAKAMPVIIVSGYRLEQASARAGRADPWDAYLSKPCAPDALAKKIKELLTRPGERGAGRKRGASQL